MTLKGFSPSEDEINLANQILLLSDCQRDGALKPDAAIDIFKGSGLSYHILRDIWSIADENASGDLSIYELAAAIRLMGWAQAGETLDESLLTECASGALSVSSQTKPLILSYQLVLFLPLKDSQLLDFRQSTMMIYAVLDGNSIQRVLLMAF